MIKPILLILVFAFALGNAFGQSVRSAPAPVSAAACSQLGFTIAGSTSFTLATGTGHVVFVNRLAVDNLISAGGYNIQLGPTGAGSDVGLIPANAGQLAVTAQHSGSAVYACR